MANIKARLTSAELQRQIDRAAEMRPFVWRPLRPVPLAPWDQQRLDAYRALPSWGDKKG